MTESDDSISTIVASESEEAIYETESEDEGQKIDAERRRKAQEEHPPRSTKPYECIHRQEDGIGNRI